ncbi:MAG TPA: polysaccharide deacetylase family protein [Candidatus Dormibacteraeota bacterium]|nr:polysaccharide deacetylase family protein [Candidatus Dormibacteraeota bacterium]HEX2680460.1 polysaccharide deacetylase family protein [Candidatus Dormibacteraeota bacterium]
MGKALGHLAAISAVLLAVALALQQDDSARLVVASTQAGAVASPMLVGQAQAGDREYFVNKRQFVPLGSSTIRLPILMYHYIRTPPSMRVDLLGYKLSVAPDVFQSQMDWLYVNGYHPVTFNQVRAYFAGAQPLPSKPVVITLDDGYSDLYTAAFPILRAHGFTAVAYIVSSFVDQYAYATRSQILEMDRAGIEIASHTVHHANLAGMSYGGAMFELVQSKQWLEQLVGHRVVDFAYPSGKYNSQTVQAVEQAGYNTAVTEQVSITHSYSDRYLWTRVRVGGGESLEDFVAGLGPSMDTVTVINVNIEVPAAPTVARERRLRSDV